MFSTCYQCRLELAGNEQHCAVKYRVNGKEKQKKIMNDERKKESVRAAKNAN